MLGLQRNDRRAFDPDTTPVAVAICRVGGGSTHAGLLFPDSEDRPAVLHLAFHYILIGELLAKAEGWKQAVWAAPDLEEENAEAIGALARLVWESHGDVGFAYALRYVQAVFDPANGKLLRAEDEKGFTCATFVYSIFNSRGYQLLLLDEWERRPGDIKFHAWVIGLLVKKEASEEHLLHVAQEMVDGVVRIRPSDVVAAAAGWPGPMAFQTATTIGEQAEALLDEKEE